MLVDLTALLALSGLPLRTQERPQRVIVEAAIEVEIIAQSSLLAKAQPLKQPHGWHVLDVNERLDAMQLEHIEAMLKHRVERFGHQATTLVLWTQVIANLGAEGALIPFVKAARSD